MMLLPPDSLIIARDLDFICPLQVDSEEIAVDDKISPTLIYGEVDAENTRRLVQG
jgi:hypothetical protein